MSSRHVEKKCQIDGLIGSRVSHAPVWHALTYVGGFFSKETNEAVLWYRRAVGYARDKTPKESDPAASSSLPLASSSVISVYRAQTAIFRRRKMSRIPLQMSAITGRERNEGREPRSSSTHHHLPCRYSPSLSPVSYIDIV